MIRPEFTRCSPLRIALVDRNDGHVNIVVCESDYLALKRGIENLPPGIWLRHAHASHAIDTGAPITLVQATLGHADLKTTRVYAHARPGESRYLKTK